MLSQSYSDGALTSKELEKLNDNQRERVVKILPTFFEYVSFLSLFNGAVPVYGYYDYDSFISKKNHCTKTPSTLLPSLKLFLPFLFFIGIYVFLWPIFSFGHMRTKDFEMSSWIYKLLYYHASIMLWKYKYLTGFLLSDIAVRAMGLSYNGTDEKGNHKWDRVKAIDLSIETAYSYRQIT